MTKRMFLAVHGGLLGAMLLLSGLAWLRGAALPGGLQVPVSLLWTMPACLACFSLPAGLWLYTGDRRASLEGSEKAHFVIWTGVGMMNALSHGASLAPAFGWKHDDTVFVGVLIGLTLMVVGNYSTKLRAGYPYGVVTRWTRESRHAWNKTHRLFGWMNVLVGLAAITVVLSGLSNYLPWVVLGGVSLSCLVATGASYLYWREDTGSLPV